MRILGIDPGLSGALGFHDTKTGERDVIDMPLKVLSTKRVRVKRGKLKGQMREKVHRVVDAKAVADWVELKNPTHAVCERVASRPQQGVVSVFTFGRAFGAVVGAVEAMNVSVVFISPADWKRKAGLIGKPKSASLTLARKRYKDVGHLLRLAKHDGRAEALLIGEHGTGGIEGKTVH